jgi:hypothetical protein
MVPSAWRWKKAWTSSNRKKRKKKKRQMKQTNRPIECEPVAQAVDTVWLGPEKAEKKIKEKKKGPANETRSRANQENKSNK